MKKLNSKGFGAIEAVLMVVVLGLIGGTGYYLYIQNQDSDKNNTTETTTQTATKDYQPAANTTTQEVAALNLKFDIPNTWKEKIYDSTQENYILKAWIANGIEVRLRSAKSTQCPQGDAAPLSYYQGYYEEAGVNYLSWCPEENLEQKYPVNLKNSLETVNLGNALYGDESHDCDGLFCTDEQVKDGEKIYSFTSVFNVKSDQDYPGATFYHITVGNAEAVKTTNAELINVLKSLRSIK